MLAWVTVQGYYLTDRFIWWQLPSSLKQLNWNATKFSKPKFAKLRCRTNFTFYRKSIPCPIVTPFASWSVGTSSSLLVNLTLPLVSAKQPRDDLKPLQKRGRYWPTLILFHSWVMIFHHLSAVNKKQVDVHLEYNICCQSWGVSPKPPLITATVHSKHSSDPAISQQLPSLLRRWNVELAEVLVLLE
jgi:hypothetical protein